jgi:hypothetical protein
MSNEACASYRGSERLRNDCRDDVLVEAPARQQAGRGRRGAATDDQPLGAFSFRLEGSQSGLDLAAGEALPFELVPDGGVSAPALGEDTRPLRGEPPLVEQARTAELLDRRINLLGVDAGTRKPLP